MRLSTAFVATLRENPRDADVLSQQLMMRSGMIRKHGAGLYSYLPLLVKSYHKLCRIIREEMDAIDWQEVIMPYVIPAELWKESGRWDPMGKLLLRLKDRKNNEFCLGPTHEEVVTDLVRSQVTSYKQLPLTLYQITPKFRDETRPRFGLMRAREFVMMDGYSFHVDRADLDQHYEVVAKAYAKIFARAGLQFVKVEADTGAIGGSGSHEFHVLAQSGEDCILSCSACGYAANLEKAEIPSAEKQKRDWGTPASAAPAEVSTPTQKTIEDVGKLLNIPAHRSLKTLVYRFRAAENPAESKPVVAFVLGHRQLNEIKLQAALSQAGFNILDLGPMPEPDVEKLFSSPVGFLGPLGAPQVTTFFDREILGSHDLVAGANKAGFHLSHLEAKRDFSAMTEANTKDIVSAQKGEPCPRCDGGLYEEHRGIEVGHIFKLGNKYSKALQAQFQDAQKQSQIMEMGCYGIGVTRIIAAAIEQNNDADGILWPEPLAPFQVQLINLAPEDAACKEVAEGLYQEFKSRRVEVLYDDRADLSPGVKFKDCDLLGVPRRLVVGKRGLEKGEIEFSLRKDKKKVFLKFEASKPTALAEICTQALSS